MLVDITMPKMGESIMEGTILKWLKNPGDKVERDEAILEISTDKVDTEVPSPEAGILKEQLFKENDTVEVGAVLAKLETEANAGSSEKKEEPTEEEPAEVKPAEVKPAEDKPAESEKEFKKEKVEPANEIHSPKHTRVEEKQIEKESSETQSSGFYSPLVLNIAKKEGIGMDELSKITGTGLQNRITKKDIQEYISNKGKKPAAATPASSSPKSQPQQQTQNKPEPDTAKSASKKPELPKHEINYNEEGLSVMEFDNIRQKMAEHMSASVAISPHVNAIAEVDLSKIEEARKKQGTEFEAKEGFKLTYMPFIAEAVIKALKDFPLVNSIIDDSSVPFKAITRSKINLGMAVAMDNGGLIVPVIKDADGMNLTGIARSVNDLGKRARVKKLSLDEIQGGTFTISNYGVFGNIIGTMVINQPQVAILGVGAIKKRPTVLETPEGDFVVIRPMVYLTLSFDHRLIDGALGGKFVMRVAHYLENYNS